MNDHDGHTSSPNDALDALVRSAAPTGFDAGFSSRVATRLRAEREPSLATALERQFRRIVPLAAAASLVLAGYNWWGARGSASSPLEAALNLPRVTLSAAYATSTLYGDASLPAETGTP